MVIFWRLIHLYYNLPRSWFTILMISLPPQYPYVLTRQLNFPTYVLHLNGNLRSSTFLSIGPQKSSRRLRVWKRPKKSSVQLLIRLSFLTNLNCLCELTNNGDSVSTASRCCRINGFTGKKTKISSPSVTKTLASRLVTLKACGWLRSGPS